MLWRRDAGPAASELAAECEAFLTGRYPEYLTARGDPVPTWAWTNPLAHASEDQLGTMISTRGEAMGSAGGWPHACCYVAGELLDIAERCGPLPVLQVSALIPLELELIPRRDVACWKPGTWVAAVMAVLPDRRRMQRGTPDDHGADHP